MKFFLISMLITARRVFTSSRLSITSSLVPVHGRDTSYSHHSSGWILPTPSPGRFLAETRAPAREVAPGSDRTALPGRPNSLLTRQGTTELTGPGVRPSPEVTCTALAGRAPLPTTRHPSPRAHSSGLDPETSFFRNSGSDYAISAYSKTVRLTLIKRQVFLKISSFLQTSKAVCFKRVLDSGSQ